MRIPALAVALVLTLGACDQDVDPTPAEPADPATTRVQVHFQDSSVAPEYHRSWKLTLEEKQAHLVVDSYGDKLAEETVDMPAEKWRAFVEDLPESVDGLDDPDPVDDGCSGGTSIEFAVTGGGGADTNLEIDNCANDHNSAITDEIEGLVEPFTDLVHLDRNTRT